MYATKMALRGMWYTPRMDREMNRFLNVALKAIRTAERIVTRYYAEGVTTEMKKDETPVTIADREAEQAIRKTITAAFPDHGFLGEEYGGTKSPGAYCWIIDPIDGTRNFSRHVPLFGTLLALMRKDELLLGVSSCPALRERLHAVKGVGAFCGKERIRVSDTTDLRKASVSFGWLEMFERTGHMDGLHKTIQACDHSVAVGDASAYHLVATGKFDAVIETSVKVWDIAAATAIIEAAGGRVTDLQGNPVSVRTTSVLATNGKIHDELLSLVK